MCFFKRKNEREELLKNKHDIESMAQYCDILLASSEENAELTDKQNELKDKIRYFNPTQNKDALSLDKKISKQLEDLRNDINKAKTLGDYSSVLTSVDDLKNTLVIERQVKSSRRK